MAEIPVLKDWKNAVEEKLKGLGYSKDDLSRMIQLCRTSSQEIAASLTFVNDQCSYVNQMTGGFLSMYRTRFGEYPATDQPVQREVGGTRAEMGPGVIPEIALDSPKRRKEAVRKKALELAPNVGDEISDQAILDGLPGMKSVAQNPKALISTIMYGFRPEFVKVDGKSGVFRRQQLIAGRVSIKPSDFRE